MALTDKQVQDIISAHKSKGNQERQVWDRHRAWYLSDFWNKSAQNVPAENEPLGDDDDLNFESNYPYAYVDTMVANVVPTNPQVVVRPRRKELKEAAKYRESLINDVFRRQALHQVLWQLATRASVYGRAFAKAVWRPADGENAFLVCDPRRIFYDRTAGKWEDLRYIIEATTLTKEEFENRVKKRGPGNEDAHYKKDIAEKAQFDHWPMWLMDKVRDQVSIQGSAQDVFQWVVVYEVYDFTTDRYLHILEGVEEPLYVGPLPHRTIRNPFFPLVFNDNLTDLGGISDVQLIANLQERLNEMDTLELWFAQSSIPVMLLNSGLVDNPETIEQALRRSDGPRDMVRVEGREAAPLGHLIGQTPTPQLSPSWGQMRDRSEKMIEFVLGIPQYSRGVVGATDVATEVALADTATRTRNGRRIKQVQDLVKWMAKAVIALYEEHLSPDSSLPIRLTGSSEILEISRNTLAAREVAEDMGEEPPDFDYDTIVYSPAENNRLVQLRNLQSFLPVLVQSPSVNQERLVGKLLELLQMDELLVTDEEKMKAQQAEAAAAQMPGELAGAPTGEDTIETGALPPGTEPAGMGGLLGGAGHPAPMPPDPSKGFQQGPLNK